MTKMFCDCCKREIRAIEKKFSMNVISSLGHKEIVINDMCVDCYDRIKQVVRGTTEVGVGEE